MVKATTSQADNLSVTEFSWVKKLEKIIAQRVHSYYWDQDLNCASTVLKVLAEIFQVTLSQQVLDAAIGMHGAGKYGAQCGLVEGSLMFLGLIGRQQELTNNSIVNHCYDFANQFEDHFGSLTCKILRPQGFKEENPPHLCEPLTKKALLFACNYIDIIGGKV